MFWRNSGACTTSTRVGRRRSPDSRSLLPTHACARARAKGTAARARQRWEKTHVKTWKLTGKRQEACLFFVFCRFWPSEYLLPSSQSTASLLHHPLFSTPSSSSSPLHPHPPLSSGCALEAVGFDAFINSPSVPLRVAPNGMDGWTDGWMEIRGSRGGGWVGVCGWGAGGAGEGG